MASVCLSLLLWPAAVLPSARVVGRRRLALSTAAALSAATLRPRRAAADRGKDLYTSDGALLQSGGGVVQDALLPQFDSSGALIVGNGYSEETAYRTVRSGPASVEVLKGWVSTDAGGLRDPVTGSAASLVRMSALPTGASSIAELGKPEQLQLVSSLGLEAGLAKATLPRRFRDASETLPRRLRDASETPPRRFRDASDTRSSDTPPSPLPSFFRRTWWLPRAAPPTAPLSPQPHNS